MQALLARARNSFTCAIDEATRGRWMRAGRRLLFDRGARRIAAACALLTLAFAAPAGAQNTLLNGANHSGSISIAGEVDTWTFTAAQNDTILLSIGEVIGGVDPGFVPWIRLRNPSNLQIASNSGNLVAQISVTAPVSGVYTVVVGSADAGNDATGDYLLTLARIPGSPVVPSDDQGGNLVNGANHPGTIHLGDLDQWTFTAAQNDSLVLSIGEVLESEVDPGFFPWIRLYGPNGALITGNSGAWVAYLAATAPLSGTYTVVVGTADAANDATGDYLLRLARMPAAFFVAADDQGGPLVNGANHPGRIGLGDLDMWSFTAAQNDSLVLSIGEVLESEVDPGFFPWIRLYGPNGALITGNSGAWVAYLAATAPLSGTYTVVVGTADAANDATGDYLLRLARMPAAFFVAADDQGGAMTPGANHAGRIELGDLDLWTFTAAQSDSIVLSIGEVLESEVDPGFFPWIRLYGPNGALITGNSGAWVAYLAATAPLSGTYTVVVATADAANDATGDYLLTLGKMPGPFVVAGGDEGGAMTPGVNHPGAIHRGDLDFWAFTATQNNAIVLTITEVMGGEVDPGFFPWIRLYGPSGALVASNSGNITAQINVSAPQTGTYTVVVGTADAANDATGQYLLRVTGITVVCPIAVDFTLAAAPPGGGGYASTVTAPFGCGWSAASNASWFTITSGAVGNGAGTINFAIAPNGTFSPRAATVTIAGTGYVVVQHPVLIPRATSLSFDGDPLADVGVYRHSTGQWFIAQSSGVVISESWGAPSFGDMPVSGDFDGDGRDDIGVYRRSTGEWFINRSTAGFLHVPWGAPSLNDVPVPGDYDGDGKTDIGVYRVNTGDWIIARSSTGTVLSLTWGAPALADVPVPADFDGDGRTDIAVFRLATGEWFVNQSAAGFKTLTWGAASAGDIPVSGDYDGDGKADIGVYRSSTGEWYIARSDGGGMLYQRWGAPAQGDIPSPSDFDGDGRMDITVFRLASGQWFVIPSGGGPIFAPTWGAPSFGDRPLTYR
jgi:FG-GAP-like repeat/Putative binding domain, N-terminal